MEDIIRINDYTHKKGIKFIAAATPGLFGYIFVDFGDGFTVLDPDGENPKTSFISGISSEENGVVTVVEGHRHDLQDGDYIKISQVKGMKGINDKVFQVVVRGKELIIYSVVPCVICIKFNLTSLSKQAQNSSPLVIPGNLVLTNQVVL
eukprot:TRINITY_DN16689_c0_g1_i1.p1 TRINITY_DN16689_c0_g1~~TRINITY_DN16689_c0_g1_i1.p1  ORF type:complete len:165 (+),score=16.48 TRINITY_DN16689_c0_g1_i1:49-495(+)